MEYYCHSCQERITPVTEDIICPNCRGGFVEKIEDETPNINSASESLDGNHFNFDVPFPLNILRLLPSFDAFNSGHNNVDANMGHSQESTSSSNNSAASSSVDHPSSSYHVRSQPNQFGTSVVYRNQIPDHDIIRDVMQRVFGGFDPSHLQFSVGEAELPAWNFMELHGNTGDYAWGPNGLDNIISQLLGQLENAGPPPASKQTIAGLPIVTITQDDVDVDRDCSVCMEMFKLDEKVKKLPCEHFFHIPCIEPWLALHNTCPICRKLVEDDQSSCRPQTSISSPTQSTDAGAASTSQTPNSTEQTNSTFLSSIFPSMFGQSGNEDDDNSNNAL